MADEQAAPAPDPLQSIADALESASQATQQGFADMKAKADQTIPALQSGASQAAYKMGYGLSYGVVFAAVFVSRAIPRDNALVHGIVDGARAATDFVKESRGG
ncbi:MAG: hypothetical protein U0800_11240 [Isosphaeraceae bacterium]